MPITNIASAVEAVLRQPRRVTQHLRRPCAGGLIAILLLIAVMCGLVYGVVVGTFSAGDQLWIAPLKITGGLLFSAIICLPSLYIFSCLSGSRARLVEVAGLLAGLLALLSVLLVGFAPVALVFSTSTGNLAAMGALHLAFGLIATCFGIRFLNAGFAQLEARPAGSRIWALIFILVLLQMTTALRPILGRADEVLPGLTEKKFFIAHWTDCLHK
ncbi:MAG: hypothetical protein QOF48_3020 [Verrucomicrobiota bacterium]